MGKHVIVSEVSVAAGSIWLQLAPAAALVVFFVGGLVVYLAKFGFAGRPDAEMRQRGASAILGPFVRDFFAWLMTPLFQAILASGIPANTVTVLALLLAGASGVGVALGYFAVGGWLFLASGFLDYLDGRVARSKLQQSKSGALLDSVLDRYAEAALFAGLAWFYRETWVLLLVLGAGSASQFISYIRARCGDLGVDIGRVGVLQRPERIAILGASICLSPVLELLVHPSAAHSLNQLAIGGVAIIAVVGNATALQRLAAGIRKLQTPAQTPAQPPPRAAIFTDSARTHS